MRLAAATGMWRGSRGREREWGKGSHEREEQQQSCGQAMHASCVEPLSEASIEQNSKWAQAEELLPGTMILPTQLTFQALPWILAHHQRTPTKRKRQSWKNSGGLPSKAWPMNWRSHPSRNRARA